MFYGRPIGISPTSSPSPSWVRSSSVCSEKGVSAQNWPRRFLKCEF